MSHHRHLVSIKNSYSLSHFQNISTEIVKSHGASFSLQQLVQNQIKSEKPWPKAKFALFE